MTLDTVSFIIVGSFITLVVLSGIIQLVYGKKIQMNEIKEKDKRGGQFMIFLGSFVALLTLFMGMTLFGGEEKISKKVDLMIKSSVGVILLTVLISAILQIVYGSKINKNNLSEDDEKHGITLIVSGSVNLIMIALFCLTLYIVYRYFNPSTNDVM
jgi:uncharacterized membrane protein